VRNYKTEAIVLRRDKFGEKDRLITTFTRSFGKKTLLAKGARRPESRFASATNLFSRLDIVVAKGRSIDILTEANIINSHSAISNDLQKAKLAYWIGEVVTNSTHDEEPLPTLYELLVNSLNVIDKKGERRIVDFFAFNCLSILGYKPELNKSVYSQDPLCENGDYLFSPLLGGITENHPQNEGRAISVETIKAMRFLQNPWEKVEKLRLCQRVEKELHLHVCAFTETVMERAIKSEKL